MNKTQLIEILNDWNFWKKKPDIGIKREDSTIPSEGNPIQKTGKLIIIK